MARTDTEPPSAGDLLLLLAVANVLDALKVALGKDAAVVHQKRGALEGAQLRVRQAVGRVGAQVQAELDVRGAGVVGVLQELF